jgi:hypothetical protein
MLDAITKPGPTEMEQARVFILGTDTAIAAVGAPTGDNHRWIRL